MAAPSRALLLRLGERTLALEASAARGVVAFEDVTPLPGSRDLLHGLIPVRGSIVPLVNLTRLLGADHAPADGRAVLAEAAGQTFAFPVDDILGFTEIRNPPAADQLTTPNPHPDHDGQVIEALNPTRVVQALAELLAER